MARRILYLALALALASTGCGLAKACGEMMTGDCCCGMAGSPCREMSGDAQGGDADPRPDATLRTADHAPAAVFCPLATHPGSTPPEVIRDERPLCPVVSAAQALYIEHCAFLC